MQRINTALARGHQVAFLEDYCIELAPTVSDREGLKQHSQLWYDDMGRIVRVDASDGSTKLFEYTKEGYDLRCTTIYPDHVTIDENEYIGGTQFIPRPTIVIPVEPDEKGFIAAGPITSIAQAGLFFCQQTTRNFKV